MNVIDTGSPMSIAPIQPGWIITFTTDGESWTEPVIGWAIVADCISGLGNDTSTVIEPVLLEEGRPVTVRRYLSDRGDYPQVLNEISYFVEYRTPR